ncbi:hypothetical protein Q7P37_007407 [Cladosporium fusiforme]
MPQPKPPEAYRKPCSLCSKPRDVLVRCQIDPASITPAIPDDKKQQEQKQKQSSSSSSDDDDDDDDHEPKPSLPSPPNLKPNTWHFVCPGACWRRVSGGVIDGDLEKGREGYRYGGMWKNKHAGVSAKVPRRLKGKMVRGGGEGGDEREGGDAGGGKLVV